MTCKLVVPTTGRAAAKANARATEIPVRTPVKLPGPSDTANLLRSLNATPEATMTSAIIGRSRSECPLSIETHCAAVCATPLESRQHNAAEQAPKQVSKARVGIVLRDECGHGSDGAPNVCNPTGACAYQIFCRRASVKTSDAAKCRSDNLGKLREVKPWTAGKQTCWVAITNVQQEI